MAFLLKYDLYSESWANQSTKHNANNDLEGHTLFRASDNSRGKKSNFVGFAETNSRRKQPISREFSEQISPKSKEERIQKKIYWKDVKFRARKKTQFKFIQHSSEGNCTCFEQKEKHKLYRNTWPINLLFQLQFRAEHSNAINLFSLLTLLCCFGKIVGDRRFKSICEVKTLLCLRSCPARTIKHVPALLQTAVFIHILYSFNEKSSHFLCFIYCSLCISPGACHKKKSRGNFVKQASHKFRYLNWTLNNAKTFGGTFVTCTEVN